MLYRDISHVNWSLLETPTDSLEVLNMEGSWLVPQLLALVASQITPVKTEAGYSFTETVKNAIEQAKGGKVVYPSGRALSSAELRGIFSYLSHAPRGEVIGKGKVQSSKEFIRYATGVPLILSAFKEYKDIPYSAWDWTEELTPFTAYILDVEICTLIPYINEPLTLSWSDEQLIQLRTEGGTFKSGAKVGQVKSLNQITNLNTTSDAEFNALPKLLKLMYCQTWVYQANTRSKYMITTLDNLDTLSEPIGGGIDMFNTPKKGELVWQ